MYVIYTWEADFDSSYNWQESIRPWTDTEINIWIFNLQKGVWFLLME